jgi:hypothetical protein
MVVCHANFIRYFVCRVIPHHLSLGQFGNILDFNETAGFEGPKIEIQKLKPETCNQKPENRNPKPETRNPKPETRKLKPVARSPKPEDRNLKSETRNPKPETRNLIPETRNTGAADPDRSMAAHRARALLYHGLSQPSLILIFIV